MSKLRNINLKTVHQIVSSNLVIQNLTGRVPAGMTRWFTMVRVEPISAGVATALGVHIASMPLSNPTLASVVATTSRKMQINLRVLDDSGFCKDGYVQVPRVPNLDAPLFSIASEMWLGVAGTLSTAHVTLQYYDE